MFLLCLTVFYFFHPPSERPALRNQQNFEAGREDLLFTLFRKKLRADVCVCVWVCVCVCVCVCVRAERACVCPSNNERRI